jgi:hypothetical protein
MLDLAATAIPRRITSRSSGVEKHLGPYSAKIQVI